MSIYSGFATRNLQQIYDYLVKDLIFILSKRIIKFYQNQKVDEIKFNSLIKQFFTKLSNLEKQKYLEPNISTALYNILQYILKKQTFNGYQEQIQYFQNKNSLWVRIQDKESLKSNPPSLQKNQQSDKISKQNHVVQRQEPTKKLTVLQRKKHPIFVNKQKNHHSTFLIKHQNPQIQDIQNSRNHQHFFNKTMRLNQIKRSQPKNTPQRKSVLKKRLQYQLNSNLSPNKTSFRPFNNKKQPSQQYKQQYTQEQGKICKNCNCQRPKSKHINYSKLQVPQIVKQYICQTNHEYMKHFRKRKLRHPLQYV